MKPPVLSLFLVATLLAAAAVFSPGSARPALALTNCSVSDLSINADEQAFLSLINNYRAQNGLGALTISTSLTRAATWLATDMAAKRYFSHTDSLGRSFGARLSQCDASGGSAGENIAAGYQTAQSVFDGWRTSSGHNANMLNSSYRSIGIARVTGGSYGVYWVTDFSSQAGSGGSGGGGSTTPSPAAPTQAKAAITSPQPGSTLPAGGSATFAWNAPSGADEYFFYLGTSAGSNNLYGRSQGLSRSLTIASLPRNVSTVYVRLWTRDGDTWRYNDYTYRLR